MRHFILYTAILLTASACSTYQYLTVDSPQLKKNDLDQLTFENDTLRLTYNFTGKDGPLNVIIYNKTSQPLYVNWKKSAYIRNEQSVSLYNNNVIVLGHTYSKTYRTSNWTSSSSANFAASFALPEGMDFIPPASSISKELPQLGLTGSLETPMPDTIQDKRLAITGMNDIKFKQIHFAADSSPVRFKSYLTFSLGDNNPKEFSETNLFYVAEIDETESSPDIFALYRQKGDQFYVKQRAQ
jgi:hypothetical protein